jgi:hypothetical protein
MTTTTWFAMALTERQRNYLSRLEHDGIDPESIALLASYYEWQNRIMLRR